MAPASEQRRPGRAFRGKAGDRELEAVGRLRRVAQLHGGQALRRGETHIVMTARQTISPARSFTSTRHRHVAPRPFGDLADASRWASTSDSAFFRYSTAMPLGSQRIAGGIVISVIVPAASSARLHIAIACTVPMWFVTARRLRIDTRA